MNTNNATALSVASPAPSDGKFETAEKAPPSSSALRLVREIEDHDLRDVRGYKRPKATLPGYHKGRAPKSKGRTYPPSPPTAAEIQKLRAATTDTPTGLRLNALIVLLWRSGLRISEALALVDDDLDEKNRTVVVRHGKGDKRRTSVMDAWGWEKIQPWLEYRKTLPVGPVFCVVTGPTAGWRQWSDADVRRSMKKLAARAGVRKRIAPHQFRHGFAVSLFTDEVNLFAIQKAMGHARLDVTQIYLESISPVTLLQPIVNRPAPVVEI